MSVAVALPRVAAPPGALAQRLPLRAGQAGGPVADPAAARGLLARSGGFRGRCQSAELAAGRHGLRPLDEPDRLGRTARRPVVLLQLGTAAVDVSGRGRRLRHRGPAGHVATPARRRAIAAADLRRPRRWPASPSSCCWSVGLAASGIVGGVIAVGNRSLVGLDGHVLAPGEAARAVRARLGLRAGADAGLRGGRAARLGALGRSPMGLVMPALLAVLLAARAAAAAAGRRPRRPAELRRSWPGAACSPTRRRSPRSSSASWSAWLGRWPQRPGLSAVRAPRLHRSGQRRSRTARTRHGGAAAGGGLSPSPSGRSPSRRRQQGPGSSGPSWTAHSRRRTPICTGCRPGAPPSGRDGGAAADQRVLRQGRLPGRGQGPGQRLAVCRVLAHARRQGHRLGDLPARRQAGRTLRRRR